MTALLFVFAGLAVTRVTLGLSQGDFSDYTVFAMIYECLTVAFLLWRFMSSSSEIEASAGGA